MPLWSAGNIHWFQALYYLASFFAQYGPNCTTWLIAGELIPTDARAMAHGWAAAIGGAAPPPCPACLAWHRCLPFPGWSSLKSIEASILRGNLSQGCV